MDFEWEDTKTALNFRKHGIAFEDAVHVFLDRGRIDIVDDRNDYGEERWLTIGRVAPAVWVVACTLRTTDGEVVHTISARKVSASASERGQYHEIQA